MFDTLFILLAAAGFVLVVMERGRRWLLAVAVSCYALVAIALANFQPELLLPAMLIAAALELWGLRKAVGKLRDDDESMLLRRERRS